MAENINKLPSGAYRAQVVVGGRRVGATFETMREAVAWRDQQRVLAKSTKKGALGDVHSLRQAIIRYRDEVADENKGAEWERVRCDKFLRDTNLPLDLPLSKITDEHLERWRDARLSEVAAGSVRRELSLMGSVFKAARRRWKWVKVSPLDEVERPDAPPHRERVFTRAEIKAILRKLGHRAARPQSIQQVIAVVFLVALRTGMRSSEITESTWPAFHGSYLSLPTSKNGAARDVPLSRKARRYFEWMRGWDETKVFPVKARCRDTMWREARDLAGVEGVRFHDSRHTAATWVGRNVGREKKISLIDFCKAFGWKDPRYALVYCNPTAAEIAEML